VLAHSLILLMGQRLVKKLCDCKNCKMKEDIEQLYYQPFLEDINNKFKEQDFNICYPT
jgi:type II secretory ATPase GspE/PulE/Tfp pilus assembly ATPase PilB-like protein